MPNKNKSTDVNTSKTKKKVGAESIKTGIMGLGMLLTIVSIVYSTATIILGAEGQLRYALLAPQALFAVIVTIKQFTKS